MKVALVIEALSALPPDAEFGAVYDGFCKVGSDAIWLSKTGAVLMADPTDPLYHEEDGPVDEPVIDGRPIRQESVWARLGLPKPEDDF